VFDVSEVGVTRAPHGKFMMAIHEKCIDVPSTDAILISSAIELQLHNSNKNIQFSFEGEIYS